MALETQQIPVTFQAIDTKTAPQLLEPGKFVRLENAIRRKTGKIEKRLGTKNLVQGGTIQLTSGSHVDTFRQDLMVIGEDQLYTYNPSNDSLVLQGDIASTEVVTSAVVRNSARQSMADVAYGDGKSLFVWQDSRGVAPAEQIRYTLFDDNTGTAIVRDVLLSANALSPRVVALQNRFLILYIESGNIKSRTVFFSSPTQVSAATVVVTTAGTLLDATRYGGAAFIGYAGAATDTYAVGYVTADGVIGNGTNGWPAPVTFTATTTIRCLSTVSDEIAGYVYLLYANQTSARIVGWTVSLDGHQDALLETVSDVRNITGAVDGSVFAYYEIGTPVSVAASKNQRVNSQSASYTPSGFTVGTAAIFKRSVGLAGKAFSDAGYKYILVTYESALQSTYYMVRSDGLLVARISPGVGGGLTRTAQPQAVPNPANLQSGLSSVYQAADSSYRYATTYKTKFAADIGGTVYSPSQGIQKTNIRLSRDAYNGKTLGDNYHLSGGMLYIYDGAAPVEHGFLVYPEDVSAQPFTLTFAPGSVDTTTDTITIASHGLLSGNQIVLSNGTGVTPAGLNTTETFYVINPTTNTFQLSRSFEGAAIDLGPLYTVLPADVNTTTNVITHDGFRKNGDAFTVTTTGTLPSPLVVATTYYVVSATDTTFQISATLGGSALDITTTGTGTMSMQFGAGTGTNTLETGGGELPVGTWYYAVTYEWVDAQGQIHRSAPGTANVEQTVDGQFIRIFYPTLRLTEKDSVTRANAKVVLYRGLTTDADQVLYRLLEQDNDTGTDSGYFVDYGLPSITLATQEVLYTTGGVVENTAAPASTCAATYRGRLFLGGLEDGNSIAYTKPQVYGEGAAFSDLFTIRCDPRGGPVTALYPMDDKLIIFKQDAIFTLTGDGPFDTGVGSDYTDPQLVATDVGSKYQNSLVITPNGLMFKSDKGIYLLDRSLSTIYIGAAVEVYNDLTVTSAVVLEDQNEVRFTTEDTCLVYNYYFNQWSTFTNYDAVAAVGSSGGYYHLKSNGTLRKETNAYNDAGSRYAMLVETGWIGFAGVQGYQRIYQIYGLGDFLTDHYTRIKLGYDYEDAYTETVYFNVDNGLDLEYYGEGTYGEGVYGGSGSGVYQWQLNPRRQKCQAIRLLIDDIDTKTDNGGPSFAFVSLNFLAGIKPSGPRFGSNKNIGSGD